ncbi:hypothetical protein BJP34_03245 [Moorena producens PAL-8-15-08-1]|uniref:Uncharacterized protein n=1 Tax=Moorena producens PAL-8-15-08-1 TaxID=1458985 RepID=A0A1D8TLW8_9CYAN|nr:hypothetical protein BJP34_03245 [Moorena producens PAL-8-15-08-1]
MRDHLVLLKPPLVPQSWGTLTVFSPQNWGARGAKPYPESATPGRENRSGKCKRTVVSGQRSALAQASSCL